MSSGHPTSVPTPQPTMSYRARRASLASASREGSFDNNPTPFRRGSDTTSYFNFDASSGRRGSTTNRRRMSVQVDQAPSSSQTTLAPTGQFPDNPATRKENNKVAQSPGSQRPGVLSRVSSYASQVSAFSDSSAKDGPESTAPESYREKVQRLRSRSREIIENNVGECAIHFVSLP